MIISHTSPCTFLRGVDPRMSYNIIPRSDAVAPSKWCSTALNLTWLTLSTPQLKVRTGSVRLSSQILTSSPLVAKMSSFQWWSIQWNTDCRNGKQRLSDHTEPGLSQWENILHSSLIGWDLAQLALRWLNLVVEKCLTDIYWDIHMSNASSVKNNDIMPVHGIQWAKIKDSITDTECPPILNPWRLSDAFMRQQPRSSLVQTMACHLFDAKPLSEPMLPYC